jgi:hypothetical protein
MHLNLNSLLHSQTNQFIALLLAIYCPMALAALKILHFLSADGLSIGLVLLWLLGVAATVLHLLNSWLGSRLYQRRIDRPNERPRHF